MEACHGFRPQPIYNKGNNNSYVNLIMHDGGHFYTDWTATGVEIIGCIIYNNGWDREAGDVNSDGHGLYLKSSSGITVKDNIVFNDFAYGIHAYTEPGEAINNITLVGNIAFNNGTLSGNVGSSNILLGGKVSSSGGAVENNVTYFSPEEQGIQMSSNVRFGWQSFPNGDIRVRFNYFVGKGSGSANVVDVGYWQNNDFNGNTIVGCKPPPTGSCGGLLVTLNQPDPPGTGYAGYLWRNNIHQRDPLSLSWQYTTAQGVLTTKAWNQWKQTVVVQDNAMNGLPTSAKVIVRGNGWEPGRGTIVVFNWQNQQTVSVDLSGVVPVGWTYRIENVQDLFNPTPVTQGVYAGGSINLPIIAVLAPPDPVGNEPRPPRPTGTGFNVYLVTSGP
jgi:parallel beta-helix repeat protein